MLSNNLVFFFILFSVTISDELDCDNYWYQVNETCDDNYYSPTIAIQTLSAYTATLETYSKISLSIKANHDVMITPHCISMDIDINPSIMTYFAHEWLSNNIDWPSSHQIGEIITFTDEDSSEYITFSAEKPCILSPNGTNALILLFNTNFNGYSIETHDVETCTNEKSKNSLNVYDIFYKSDETEEEEEKCSSHESRTTRWNFSILDEDDVDIQQTKIIYEYISQINKSNDSLIMSLIVVIIVLNICCCALLWFFNQNQFYQNINEIRQNIDYLYGDKKRGGNNNFINDDSADTNTEDDDESDEDTEEEDDDDDDKRVIISINCDEIHAEETSKHNISIMATGDLSETNSTDTSLPAPSPSDRNIAASNIAMYGDQNGNDSDDVSEKRDNEKTHKLEIQKDGNKNNIVWVNQSYFDSNSRDDNYNLFKLRLQNSNASSTSLISDIGSVDTLSPKMAIAKKANDKLNKLRIVLPPKSAPNKMNAINTNGSSTSHHTSDTTLSAMTLSADDIGDFLSPTLCSQNNAMHRINENEATPVAKKRNKSSNKRATKGQNKSNDNDSLFSVASSIRLPAYHPNKIKVLNDNKHIPYNKTFIIAVTPPIHDYDYEEFTRRNRRKQKSKMLITKENVNANHTADAAHFALPQTHEMHLYHTNMNR